MPRIVLLLALILLGCSGPERKPETQPTPSATADAEKTEKRSFFDDFVDPQDGAFDIDGFLDQEHGFLPLIVPITEPAIGLGLVGALVFFHDKAIAESSGPPTLTAVAGGWTESDTWLGAVAHQHVWKKGAIRYLGAVGYANVNLEFYGIGSSPSDDSSIALNFEGFFLMQEGQFRLGQSKWFLGADYIYTDISTSFQIPVLPVPPIRLTQRASGLGGFVAYDSRNNHFTPTKGIHTQLGGRWYGEAIGSDNDFFKVRGIFRTWIPVSSRIVLGLRFDVEAVSDDAPLYELAFIKMRGVPAFRYVDNLALTLEVEPRIQFTERWGAVVFGGAGQVADDFSDLGDESAVFAVGGGFRYLIARRRGIQAGIDVAYSDDEWAFYFTVGSAWLR